MIRFRVDLGSVRWAISPIHEAVSLVRLTTEPHRHPGYVEWLRRRQARWADLDLSPLTMFMARDVYRPDFLEPPPQHPRTTFADGLAAARAADVEQVRAELASATGAWPPRRRAEVLRDPGLVRDRALSTLTSVWERGLAAEWPAMRAALAEDLTQRAFDAMELGAERALRGLHPSITASDGLVSVDRSPDLTLDVDTLVLVPSLFISDRAQCTTSSVWGAAIYYPCPQRYLWRSAADLSQLVAAVGASRAACLAAVADPQSTSELASQLGLSASTVSEHLAAMREAGWMHATRDGHRVVHRLTPLGRALLDACR